MDRSVALSKLKHLHTELGDWVYTTSVDQAQLRAFEYRKDARGLDSFEDPRATTLLIKACKIESVAECLVALNGDVPPPPGEPYPENVCSLIEFKERKSAVDTVVEFMGEGSAFERDDVVEDMTDEPEIFTLSQLKSTPKPRFALGDAAWIADYGDAEFSFGDPPSPIVGYVPVTIVGMELYPDEVMYMFGEYDPDDGDVVTNFETLPDECFFVDCPILAPARVRPALSIVK